MPCARREPPTPALKTVGFKWRGGGLGGVRTKNSVGGCVLFDKIMNLQGVKPTIQPLGVGYANGPKKGRNGGGMWRFPHIYGPAWLCSNNLCEDDLKNSVAFSKTTAQRIYPKQHPPKNRVKTT